MSSSSSFLLLVALIIVCRRPNFIPVFWPLNALGAQLLHVHSTCNNVRRHQDAVVGANWASQPSTKQRHHRVKSAYRSRFFISPRTVQRARENLESREGTRMSGSVSGHFGMPFKFQGSRIVQWVQNSPKGTTNETSLG